MGPQSKYSKGVRTFVLPLQSIQWFINVLKTVYLKYLQVMPYEHGLEFSQFNSQKFMHRQIPQAIM